jgi:hypothetical protein
VYELLITPFSASSTPEKAPSRHVGEEGNIRG